MSDLTAQTFSASDVEVLEQTRVYQGFFHVNCYTLRHRLYAGGWSTPLVREVFERGSAVGVLLFDPLQNAIVLIEQFRAGALHHPRGPWLFELVAGMCKPSESFEDVARRETLEETGLTVLDLVPIFPFAPTPGACSERIMLFCGRVDARGAGGFYGLADEQEDICVRVVPLKTVYAAVQQGYIDNAIAIIAIQWLQLNELMIRTLWKTSS